ncbi:hypothetical protein OG21DRAFT_141321 [Imleria badia]|nr:hypothetical protein OG21DRAFT_141321 [Imleria badia]
MLPSSSFHFRKTKNMPRDYHARKPTCRSRFRDVSHMKLTDIFKSLRRRRLRSDISRRSSLTHSLSFPPPLTDHDSSPVQLPSHDPSTSSPVRYRSDALSILSATEEDCSSGMSNLSTGLQGIPPDAERRRHLSLRPVSTFITSPSMFQLRSASTGDHLVDQLEEHLRQLSLGDASTDHVALPKNSSRDIIPMDMSMDASLPRTIGLGTSSRRALSNSDAQKPVSSPRAENVVPTILITSVDAKHSKPLPSSSQRPSRTPLGSSTFINHPTDVHSTDLKQTTPRDDPFATQQPGFAYPPDYNLTFRLPSFPSAYSNPSKYPPETPTPMCCDHFGDCSGDLWEVLHPPLVVAYS